MSTYKVNLNQVDPVILKNEIQKFRELKTIELDKINKTRNRLAKRIWKLRKNYKTKSENKLEEKVALYTNEIHEIFEKANKKELQSLINLFNDKISIVKTELRKSLDLKTTEILLNKIQEVINQIPPSECINIKVSQQIYTELKSRLKIQSNDLFYDRKIKVSPNKDIKLGNSSIELESGKISLDIPDYFEQITSSISI